MAAVNKTNGDVLSPLFKLKYRVRLLFWVDISIVTADIPPELLKTAKEISVE